MPDFSSYASPHLRKALFDRLHPGCFTDYEVIPFDEAYPGVAPGPAEPVTAIRFTIWRENADGEVVERWEGLKEIDQKYQPKNSRNWVDRFIDAEEFTVDKTKAMGRALGDAGVPSKLPECKLLMAWVSELEGRPPAPSVRRSNDRYSGQANADDIDSPDAGADGEETLEQIVAGHFLNLEGELKQRLAKRAREELGVNNILRSGEHAAEVLKLIGRLGDPDEGDPPE